MTFLVCLSATKLVIFKNLIGLWVFPETEPETRVLVRAVNLGVGPRNTKGAGGGVGREAGGGGQGRAEGPYQAMPTPGSRDQYRDHCKDGGLRALSAGGSEADHTLPSRL